MFNAVISACAKRVQWERVLSLLVELQMSGLSPTIITCGASISACEKASQWQTALQLFSSVSKDFVPDPWIFAQIGFVLRRMAPPSYKLVYAPICIIHYCYYSYRPT